MAENLARTPGTGDNLPGASKDGAKCPKCDRPRLSLNKRCDCGYEYPLQLDNTPWTDPGSGENQGSREGLPIVEPFPQEPERDVPYPHRGKLAGGLALLALAAIGLLFWLVPKESPDTLEAAALQTFAEGISRASAENTKRKHPVPWPPSVGRYFRVYEANTKADKEWAARTDQALWSAIFTPLPTSAGGTAPETSVSIPEWDNEKFGAHNTADFRRTIGVRDAGDIPKGVEARGEYWLVVSRRVTPLFRQVSLRLWHPDTYKVGAFYAPEPYRTNWLLWYWKTLLGIAIVCIACFSANFLCLRRHAHVKQLQWQIWEDARSKRKKEAAKLMQQAREKASGGNFAAARVLAEDAYGKDPEAEETETFLLKLDGTGGRGPRKEDFVNEATLAPATTELYLRFLGTPLSYRFPEDGGEILAGRRRNDGNEPGEKAADLVLRVTDDKKSQRISRAHFRVQRISNEYYLFDLSSGYTTVNGRVVPSPESPVRLQNGDLIDVAGVLKLDVTLRQTRPTSIKRVGANARNGNLEVEVSRGELVTMRDEASGG